MLGAISNTFIFLAILLVLVVLAMLLLGGKRKPRPRQKIEMPQRAKAAQPSAPASNAVSTAKKAPKKKAAAKGSKGDDLQRIKGIGPTLEKKLKGEGITQFAQIAKWTEADRTKFSELLSFKGRIEREEWVQQAKVLASES